MNRRNLLGLAALAPLMMPPSVARAEAELDEQDLRDITELQAIITADTSAFDVYYGTPRPPEGLLCPSCEREIIAPYPRVDRYLLGPYMYHTNVYVNGVQNMYVYEAGHGWYAEIVPNGNDAPTDYGFASCPVCDNWLRRIVHADFVLDIEDEDVNGKPIRRRIQL